MVKESSTWYLPFRGLEPFGRDMDALFGLRFGGWDRAGLPGRALPTGYVPPIDTYLDGTTFRITVDLPGVEPTEVELTVQDNQLTLRGERKAGQEAKDEDYFHREVRYGRFVRTFPLPAGVKADAVQACYRNGVLDIALPLPASMRTQKVPIESGGEEHQSIAG
jgi:HSP20 family protein